jgi:hypothetical protein
MKIEILYVDGCPNLRPALQQVRLALQSGTQEALIEEVEITDATMAQNLAFLGSPTIRIDGLDVEIPARALKSFGLGCRIYSGQGSKIGIPSVALIQQAIVEAQRFP